MTVDKEYLLKSMEMTKVRIENSRLVAEKARKQGAVISPSEDCIAQLVQVEIKLDALILLLEKTGVDMQDMPEQMKIACDLGTQTALNLRAMFG